MEFYITLCRGTESNPRGINVMGNETREVRLSFCNEPWIDRLAPSHQGRNPINTK